MLHKHKHMNSMDPCSSVISISQSGVSGKSMLRDDNRWFGEKNQGVPQSNQFVKICMLTAPSPQIHNARWGFLAVEKSCKKESWFLLFTSFPQGAQTLPSPHSSRRDGFKRQICYPFPAQSLSMTPHCPPDQVNLFQMPTCPRGGLDGVAWCPAFHCHLAAWRPVLSALVLPGHPSELWTG